MADDFPWLVVIVTVIAGIPIIGGILSFAASTLQSRTTISGSRMKSGEGAKEDVKEILHKMDPVDSLYFDVSVARHLLEEGDHKKALEWLDPNHALGELRKSCEAKFLTSIEMDKIGEDIIAIKNAVDYGEFAKAHGIIVPLQERLAEKAYTTFVELDPVPDGWLDHRFEAAREKKVAEWRAKGYPEGLIQKTLKWADEWAKGIAERFIRDPVTRAQVAETLYPEALALSERFIEGIAGPS